MKIKLRLILLIYILIGNKLFAINTENSVFLSGFDTKSKSTTSTYLFEGCGNLDSKSVSFLAAIAPPTAIAGSSCGPGVVTLSATGATGDIIEWFSSQTSPTVLATGNTYSPVVSSTTTFYVSARNGAETSTRVPVVASIYTNPPAVTLTASPANNVINPLCLGTSVTFTASGGADLFEFSVDGVVKQAMSSSRVYTTTALTNGQTVSVRSRYAVTLDGNLTETAWGTGALEDNVGGVSLSGNASNGYINALKISPTEDKLVFGIAGKALNFRRIMLFLDTKTGGFNVSNYGDENGTLPDVRAFNYFNNNPSTFDSYFTADYCIAIATDTGETNYYADVIELKTGNSTKTYLGTAKTGSPSGIMGVDKNNTGITDYDKGFEVVVDKSAIGYTTGDVKFFAFTMQDNTSSNYNVTNSFLSPATRTSDYGSGAINYNSEVPNPVVVAGAALTPCYSTASLIMNFSDSPTIATVGGNQSRCTFTSAALGGNTPVSGIGQWTKKSGPGTVTFSDSSAGNSTATVSDSGTYIFTWTISNGQCAISSADVTVVYTITDAPTGVASQNFCKLNNPKVSDLVAVGDAIEWFSTTTGGVAIPTNTDLVSGIYYAEQTNITTACKSISRLQVSVSVDDPLGPIVTATQTFCNSATIADLIATGTAVKWYEAPTGGLPLATNTPLINGETYYATQTLNGTLSCESFPRTPTTVTINVNPVPTGSGLQTVCNSGTVADLVASGVGIITWYANSTGGVALSNSAVLVSGTTYYASQTIGTCESASRYPLTVTVNNPQVPVSGGNQSVCATSPLQTLTASATVSSGSIVWYDALTNGTLVGSPVLNTLGSITYYAQNTIASCASVTRTAVTLEIKDSPFLNIVTKTCSADLLTYTVDFTVASGSTITWLPAVGSLIGNSITGITSGTDIVITADNGNGCVENFTATAPNCSCAIIANPISGGDQLICEGDAIPSLSATVNAGETVDWYSVNSGGTVLLSNSPSYTPMVTLPGVYTFYAEAKKTVDGCLSSSRTAVSLTINSQSKPSGSDIQTFCESENATVANLLAFGTNIKWYADATGGVPLSSSDALVDAEDYYASQKATTGLLCESLERLKVVVTINKPAAPTTTVTSQVFCNSATVSDLVVTGTNINWYDSTNTLLTPSSSLADGVYSATQTISGCESVFKLNVTVTINKPSAITISNAITFCESENATVASLSTKATSGSNIKWYSSALGITPLLDTVPLIDGTYYGTQTISGCESSPRVVVAVAINAPAAPIGNGLQSFCSSQAPTIANLSVNGSFPIIWYDGPTLGTVLASNTLLLDGSKYYAAQTISGCESVNRLEVSTVVVNPLTPTIDSFTPLFCESQNATLASIVLKGIANNSNVVWYDAPVNGTIQTSNTPLTTGSKYYASQQSTTPIIGCESINRLQVSPIIDKQQTAVIDSVTQPTCAVNTGSIVFSGLPTTGNWTILPSSGTAVTGTGATYILAGLSADTDYTFKVTNANGCTSVASTMVVKINAIPTAPLVPTVSNSIQPTCAVPTGTIVITPQQGMEYSLDGVNYKSTTIFEFLLPNDYTLYVRNSLDPTCLAVSVSAITINAIPTTPVVPTALSIVQPTCAVPTGTITLTPQTGMEYSLDGTTYQASNVFSALLPNDYTLYARNSLDTTCLAVTVNATTINAIPTAPIVPTALSEVQPTCAVPTGTITITPQLGIEYSLDGANYQGSNVFSGLQPNNYTLYVRTIGDTSCLSVSLQNVTINSTPIVPVTPTVLRVVQPTCVEPFGVIEIEAIADVEYSIGNGYQDSPVFLNLNPNNYTISVRFKSNTSCVSIGATVLINAIPPQIQFESIATCESNQYELIASPLSNSFDPTAVSYIWKDQNGVVIGTNSNVLNVTEVVKGSAQTESFPLVYTLTVQSSTTVCETTSSIVIESIYCDIQKGISPDGNGSNDFFDLRLMDVKNLEIFNRYGLQVYQQSNYKDQWFGQTNNGEELPSATYYYVIAFNNGETKTGWIYLIREN